MDTATLTFELGNTSLRFSIDTFAQLDAAYDAIAHYMTATTSATPPAAEVSYNVTVDPTGGILAAAAAAAEDTAGEGTDHPTPVVGRRPLGGMGRV